jgi:predicted permease
MNDLGFALRMLRRNPGFTTVAVLTLALGIGANTAIFTLVNALLLRALPAVREPHQLFLVTDAGNASLGYPLYEQFRDENKSFPGMFAADHIGKRRLSVAGPVGAEAEPVWAQAVSGNFFAVLGVGAAVGRTFTPQDDRAGDPQAVAVISHALWQRRFGLDPAVIGQRIMLDDVPFTVVGVTPQGFFGFEVGRSPDLWWPIQMYPQVKGKDREGLLADKGSWWLRVMGRLKPGVTVKQARAELDVMFQRMLTELAAHYGLTGKERQRFLGGRRIELEPGVAGYTDLRQTFEKPLFILTVVTGAVLLVACANLAGLLLARGAARQRELTVRAALGAGRLALIRQLVTESLLLAVLGGLLGLLLAQWGVRLLATFLPGYGETVVLGLAPDLRILAFTFGVSALSGVCFGMAPAWQGSRFDLATAIKGEAGSLMGRKSGQFGNKVLVVTQIALSCCLLIGAGLFVQTVQRLKALDVGFNRENLMVFSLDLGKDYDEARRVSMHHEVYRRVESLPGVRSASFSTIRSLSGSEWGWGPGKVAMEGLSSSADEGLEVRGTGVGPRYFETMGIPLLRGRAFGPQDAASASAPLTNQARRPVIIDDTTARKLFGDGDPVGKLLRPIGRDWPPLEVIGVVKNVIHKDLRRGWRISIYGLETQRPGEFFFVRTTGSPPAVAGGIRRIVRELDPKVEVADLRTMEQLVNEQLLRERTLSRLAGFFSLLALVLACLGLYGLLSYAVARRTPEIGVRMALGAQAGDVLSLVIRQGMALTLLGCLLGLVLALALTRLVSSLLYGVTATDPLTFALTVLLLVGVALAACWLPARRAAQVDPMVALRYE